MQSKHLSKSAYQRKTQKASWRSRIVGSNLFTFILIVLLLTSFVRVTKEVLLRYEINNEINELEDRLSQLDTKTSELQELMKYMKTDDYIEKQARLQLNLSRPGETQVNIAGGDENYIEIAARDQKSNVLKWFNYFFE